MKTVAQFGRAVWLALIIQLCSVQAVLAHALPGSVLVFAPQDEGLALTLSLPIEDLVFAAPELEALNAAVVGAPVSDALVTALAAYFDQHLRLEQSSEAIAVTLVGGTLQSGYNAHVGDFGLLELQFDVASSGASDGLPMTLIYDAVMHEVRNHRATVYWDDGASAVLGLADFGFRPVDGAQSPVVLENPRN